MKHFINVQGVIPLILLLAVLGTPISGHTQDTIPVHPPHDTTAIGPIPEIEDESLPEAPPVTAPSQVAPQTPVTRNPGEARGKDERRTTIRPVVSSPVSDSEPPPPPQSVGNTQTNVVDDRRSRAQEPVPAGDSASIQNGARSDSVVYAAYISAVRAYYEGREKKYRLNDSLRALVSAHQAWTLKNRQSAMKRQQFIGIVVFCVAVVLVAIGVVFAWMQFRIAMRHAKAGEILPSSTIKASIGSIEVSSSVLGILILALSLVFFYLYLRYVFQLTVLSG